MASSRPSLDSLAAEIRLQILECCPDIPTAASLARTSKVFYSLWDRFYQQICEIIMMRTMECYDDALYLAEIQDAPVQQPYLGFKDHVSRLLSNAKIVERACNALRTAVSEESSLKIEAWPSPTERARFFHIYYFIWTVTTTTRPGRSSQGQVFDEIFEAASKYDFRTAYLLLDWMTNLLRTHDNNRSTPPGEVLWMVLWAHDSDFYRSKRMPVLEAYDQYLLYRMFPTLQRKASRQISDAEDDERFWSWLLSLEKGEGWKILRDDHQHFFDDIHGS